MNAVPALLGLVLIAGMFAVGRRAFADARFGALAALFLALSPLLWRQLQAAPASLYPLPFVIGWLVAVAYAKDGRGPWWAVAAGALLGAGVYASNAAAVMMPLYLLLTLAIFAFARAAAHRHLVVCAAVFAVVAAPFALSLVLNPDDFRAAINAHHLYDADRFNVLQGAREVFSWVGLTARSEVYWDYLNPAFLFLTGGVLFPALVVLLPVGMLGILARASTPFARLTLAGVLVAPCAAALTAEAPIPGRILFILPFAALVSTYGVEYAVAVWKRRASVVAESPRQVRQPHG